MKHEDVGRSEKPLIQLPWPKDPSMQERNVFSVSCTLVNVLNRSQVYYSNTNTVVTKEKEYCVVADTIFHAL